MAPPYRFDGVRLLIWDSPPVLGAGIEDILRKVLYLDNTYISELKAARPFNKPGLFCVHEVRSI
jgi:crotonobetainyl-CoA:carnitine CoA-transferase CaiB-like acyl-CoA transferase